MANEKKHWYETIPGVLTGIAAVIGAITALYVAVNDKTTPPEIPTIVKEPTFVKDNGKVSLVNIGSAWRELYPNSANTALITQKGKRFKFTLQGRVQGFHFQSLGEGTISGLNVESTYQSTIPSTGRCSGKLSLDGMQIKSVCIDSLTGRYKTAWVRE